MNRTWYMVCGGPKIPTVHTNRLSSEAWIVKPSTGDDCRLFSSKESARNALADVDAPPSIVGAEERLRRNS